MPVTLDQPISWKTATADDAAMLDNLQPNIVKPHTRDFLSLLFLSFDGAEAGRALLGALAPLMKSARAHLREIEAFKQPGRTPGTPYVGVGVSRHGYDRLGVAQIPPDPSFQRGMHSEPRLNDPDVQTWDPHLRDAAALHAVVLVGDTTMEAKVAMHARIAALVDATPGVRVLGTQDGLGQHNSNGDGIEHFGYVDGRSQPLFLQEDIDAEQATTDGTANWDPAFPLRQVIVPDLAAPNPDVHFGSYFVYRKLEQNVRLFKQSEKEYAEALQLADDERAGGMLVGRFEDGTPVTVQSAEGMKHPVPNNFNYDSDKLGAKCPFLGHVRKTNPRGTGGFEAHADERKHLMARRGQTYGVRTDDANDGQIENKPQGNVGLLFMAFNSSIGNQFEFTQINWANNGGFPLVPAGAAQPGVDPVIGQTRNDAARPPMNCPVTWGDAGSMAGAPAVPRAVTMKGGAYFFMPSLAFLAGLAPAAQAKKSN